jgi:hypothetical protein
MNLKLNMKDINKILAKAHFLLVLISMSKIQWELLGLTTLAKNRET